MEKHCNTTLHKLTTINLWEMFYSSLQEYITEIVAEGFLMADIPLHKLRRAGVQKIFSYLGFKSPSKTICKRLVKKLEEEKNLEIIKKVQGKN